jgi:hypothetical protein
LNTPNDFVCTTFLPLLGLFLQTSLQDFCLKVN